MPAPPEPAEFVRVLTPAIRQAAAIARSLEGRVQNRPKSDELTAAKQALTIADVAAQEALLVPLLERFPNVALAAEEDTPSVARFPEVADALVIIDPIDGTLHFYLDAEGPYAVMVGLVVDGRYRAGLVALPREGLFFDAALGKGAHAADAEGGRGPAQPAAVGGDRVLVSTGVPEAVCVALRAAGLAPVRACGGAVAVAPLLPGVRAGLRIQSGPPLGVSVRGRIAAFVAAEAGCRVRDGSGDPFPLDTATPSPTLLVGTTDEDVALLRDVLADGYICS